ncbi:ABC transporter permease [bacterium]|nr:ABC transporter permease [bacterium]
MSEFWKKFKRQRSFYSLVGLLAIVLISAVLIKEFRTFSNLITLFRQASTLLILSAGLTAVILMNNMDLSVGAASGLIGCVVGQVLKAGVPTGLTFPVAILAGAIVGLLNGFLVATIELPSFIATFGMGWILSGLSIIVMNGMVIFGLAEEFTWFGTGYIGPIPVVTIIAAIVVVFMFVLLQKTTFGKDVYAVGSNQDAARFCGVPVKRTKYLAFMISGITAGIGGLLMTARLNAADSTMGDAYGLQTVAAVVIGGTSLLGGEGGIMGTIIGSLLLTIILNVMNLLGVSSFAQQAIVGVVIISMVLFDSYVRRRQENVGKKVIQEAKQS